MRFAVEYDIAEILEIKEPERLLQVMQEEFEERIGQRRFFRITGTPMCLGKVSVDLEDGRPRTLGEPAQSARALGRMGC
jgi:hypothetical protein